MLNELLTTAKRGKDVVRPDTVIKMLSAPKATVECDACVIVSSVVKRLLDNGKAEQAVMTFLETEVCPKFGEASDDVRSLLLQ